MLVGCAGDINPAVGPNADVTVFAQMTGRHPTVRPLVTSLEREVVTTWVEPAFRLEFADPRFFSKRRDFKNLMLIAALDRHHETAEVIEDLVGAQVFEQFRTGERPFAIYADVFAAGQTVIVIAAPDASTLEDVIATHADALYDTLEARVLEGLRKTLYVRGENPDLVGYLRDTQEWEIHAPRDFEVEEDLVRAMIVLHAESPERWLFVQRHRVAASRFTFDECLHLRRENPRLYEDEMLVDEDLRMEKTTFAGRPAFKFWGRWQSPGFVVGGPFRMYAVHAGDSLYLVDFLVYLPSLDKNPYLRQLEAIASTFRLRPS